MTDNFFHGARVKENTDLQTAINDIDSTVIGLVAVAEDADPATFPLNTPVLVTRVISVLGKAGKTGSLYKSLKAISDQVSTRVIVVRVAEAETGEGKPTQSQLIIGGTQADGSYTGMFAFLTAEQKTGYRPRILGIPEYDTAEVTAQLRVIAKQLRAFSYSYCDGCDTIAEAKTYRETFAEREGMLIWPNFIAYNPLTGVNEEFPAVAYALGLRALIDSEQGWHKSLSNVPVKNVLGISKDVFWALQAEDSDANELNANEITTLIKRDGFRFWGNRTTDTEEFIFEVYTRTAQILADSIAEAQFTTVDTPLTPANVKDVVSGINAKLQALVTAGKLIGAACWYDVVDNPVTGIRQGKAVVRYNYSPVPPLEDLTMIQTFTDQYYESAFASLGGE
ncbi:TPA: phage tail sheath subtilisin-like domain-containing protein [Klebsiella pneumoniae]|uniref:phage tail sheath subtilisin-like domain-containing protein n=1 Tax=Klebsiella TaxID=570 RepID=UPI000A114DA4|nr:MULTISPECIES: phage tail sheath subtilisin-like domain-containing protein [Klebsiella]HDT5411604.1 phage tail sheath subtilisin-like domain-containing protein [Klebsiella pneumoniae subsp. pneumoniae]EKX6048246.1 phage tail sheath subtilisin-like domain-containing protein [Klebsiella pneumoniae]MBH8311705.1 phage tail sheath subtilisin-like domain-containing protein [Klebsiella pneumoniae]MBH8358764.1 phage tail sheath subtilisin-like domain-containing protein [Klebsiella pneumoniae]MBM2667